MTTLHLLQGLFDGDVTLENQLCVAKSILSGRGDQPERQMWANVVRCCATVDGAMWQDLYGMLYEMGLVVPSPEGRCSDESRRVVNALLGSATGTVCDGSRALLAPRPPYQRISSLYSGSVRADGSDCAAAEW